MSNHSLFEAIVTSYRQAIDNRYQVEKLQRFKELSPLRESSIVAIRLFFLEYIYPPFHKREKRDSSLEAMSNIIKSPRKIWPLTRIAFRMANELGRNLGLAIKAGFHSMESYTKSTGLEKLMLIAAQKQKLNINNFRNEDILKKIIASLPKEKVFQFQKEIIAFFRSITQPELLEKMITTMYISYQVMNEHQKIYSVQEIKGLSYGIEMMKATHNLFCQMKPQEISLVIQAIELVEKDWHEQIYG